MLALYPNCITHVYAAEIISDDSDENKKTQAQASDQKKPVKLDYSFIQGGASAQLSSWEDINNKFIPGTYFLDVYVNDRKAVKREINILPEDKNDICFSAEWLQKAGVFISESFFTSQYQKERNCWVLSGAPGVIVDLDVATQTLKISLPQAALSNIPADQPWEYGNPALRGNYMVNTNVSQGGNTSFGSAALKANVGSWILNSSATASNERSQIVMLNATRALQSFKSDFTVGKTFVGDDLLGGGSIIGASLKSNNSMRSGDLGYAPVFRGIANSPSRVTLTQSGITVYSEPVPPGPFIISNVPLLSSGDVEMIVTEQNGSVTRQNFPLTVMKGMINPGQIEYSLSSGRADTSGNSATSEGYVMSASAGYGFNFLTLRSGALLHKKYQGISAAATTSFGVAGGVSLSGALSKAESGDGSRFDGSKMQAVWNKTFEGTSTGLFVSASHRTERFMEYSSFSSSDKSACRRDNASSCRPASENRGVRNELTIGFNQPVGQFFNTGLNGWRRDYWNSDVTENGLTMNVSTQISSVNLNLGGTLTQSGAGNTSWSTSLSLSVPFSVFDRRMSTYTTITTGEQGGATITSGVSGSVNERLTYALGAGRNNDGSMQTNLSGSWTGDKASMNMSMSQSRSGSTGSASLSGSILAIPAARSIIFSRNVSDTIAIANIRNTPGVRFSSGMDTTDSQGNVVIPLSDYRRNTVTVDASTLPQNIELGETSRVVVPSGNAVVYMPFETINIRRYLLQVRKSAGGFMDSGMWATGKNNIPLGFVAQNGVLMINTTEHPGDISLNGCVIRAAKIKESDKIQEVICD